MDDKDFRRRKFLREHPTHQSIPRVERRIARRSRTERTGNPRWWALTREEEAWLTRNNPLTPPPGVAPERR